MPGVEPACIEGVEAVHVLDGLDRPEHGLLVDLLGQRELDEDAVHVVASIQLVEESEQLLLRRVAGETSIEAA